jgi:hypothetical protein
VVEGALPGKELEMEIKGGMTIKESSISPRQCAGAGWSQDAIPVCIQGMDSQRHFTEVYADNGTTLNLETLEAEVRESTTQLLHNHPDIGSIVLECTNLAPFSPLIRQVSGLPVFGMDELVRFIHHCIS